MKIKGKATVETYVKKGNKWILKTKQKENIIAEKKHWKQWQELDKQIGGKAYIKTRFGNKNDKAIRQYTSYSPSKKEKVVYKINNEKDYFYS